MPMFAYRCSSCGHAFEVLIRQDEDAPSACPACGKDHPTRQLARFNTVGGRQEIAPCGDGQCGTSGCPYAAS